MQTLVLDLGNTAAKYGCFQAGQLLESGVLAMPVQLEELLKRWQPVWAIVASVTADNTAWLTALRASGAVQVLLFEAGKTPVPIQNAYATPQTLGADRLAAAVGAAYLRPGQPTLIVDAGTALKCDVVASDTFVGGSIGPGLRMRLQALHTFTGRLPLLELLPPAELVQLTGTSTASAMLSGVLNGAVLEVQGFVAAYERSYPGLGVLLTGGDAPYFAARLQGRIFVVPELVLLGLYRILAYHVDK
jgi:type III pantothenate kinase